MQLHVHKNTSLPALRYFKFGFSISASQMRMMCVNWCNWWRNIGESWSRKPRILSSLLWEEPRTSNWMVVWGTSFIPVLSRWSCVQDRACFFKLLPFLCFLFVLVISVSKTGNMISFVLSRPHVLGPNPLDIEYTFYCYKWSRLTVRKAPLFTCKMYSSTKFCSPPLFCTILLFMW